jgi:hypothetical protein
VFTRFIFYTGLVAAFVMLVKHGVNSTRTVRRDRAAGRLGLGGLFLLSGFALFALYQVSATSYLAKFHGMLAFVGINLMLAAALSRFRYFGKYGKSESDPNLHGPKATEDTEPMTLIPGHHL